ncbi:MAG: sulfurtransferase TusA family protein, partial [Planctomycetota bacterium]
DVGDLACGDLLLQLRQKLRSLPPSSRLHWIVRDPGAREDVPAWCRLTGHHLVHQDHPHYLLESKAAASPARIIPAATLDGGDLDCGSGLLLLIRRHIDPLDPGSILELHSTESTVESDLPAWCRLTDNHLVATQQDPGTRRRTYWIRKKMVAVPGSTSTPLADRTAENFQNDSRLATPLQAQPAGRPAIPAIAPPPPLAVMGIGSWPRPPQLVAALHERLSGRLESESFHQLADAAVRACVSAQQRAGVTVVTDGEQRRDSYASFVGALLDNCQLVPLTDLLPYVDDPEEFSRELKALDVPADSVRHPAVLGRLRRSTPWTLREAQFLRQITDQPIKIALPGPYLLTRTMWLECVAERVYATRDELAADLVTALRAELCELLEVGVNLVQLDAPVLSEVVFGAAVKQRSFMCGALSGKGSNADELTFAAHLLQ